MSTLPPGPSSAVLNTLRYVIDPFSAYDRLRHRYGDPVLVPSINGTLVITGAPDGAREVFTAPAETFGVFARDMLLPTFGAASIMMLSGTEHRRERRLLFPQFQLDRVRAHAQIVQDAALRHTESWRPGQRVVMQETARAISQETIIRGVFGVVSEERFARFQDALGVYARASHPSVIFFPALWRSLLGNRGPWRSFQRAATQIHALLSDEIVARKAQSGPSDDVMYLLLQARYENGEPMSDLAIRDELMTLMFAGHTTTAIAMSWAMAWLHRYPEVLAKVRAELATTTGKGPEAFADLPYLEAVCYETLRLHPVVPDVYRLLKKPLTLRGYTVPTGFGVAVSTFLLHTRDDLFPEPRRFRPERFLERKFSAFEFIPFGGGERRCLGASFALYEIKIVLGTLLRRFDLELVLRNENPRRQGLTMGPARGVPMRVLRRLE